MIIFEFESENMKLTIINNDFDIAETKKTNSNSSTFHSNVGQSSNF